MAEAMLSADTTSTSLPDLPLLLSCPSDNNCLEILEASEKLHTPTPSTPKKVQVHSKTVVINVGVEPKRQKPSPGTKVVKAVLKLNSAIQQKDRETVISHMVDLFDHNVVAVHDDEIAAGADSALTKHLALLRLKELVEHERGDIGGLNSRVAHEISRTLEALEMIYRGSPDALAASFERCGYELLSLMLQVIDLRIEDRDRDRVSGINIREKKETEEDTDVDGEDASGDEKAPASTYTDSSSDNSPVMTRTRQHGVQNAPPFPRTFDGDFQLRMATKIIAHFARVGSATQPMAHHPGLLASLKRVTDCQLSEIPTEARLNSLWIIANLACNADNMVMMACHPGLLDTLVWASFLNSDDEESSFSLRLTMEVLRSHSIAARGLLNLSWAPENKIPMSEHANLVDVLSKMIVARSTTCTITTLNNGGKRSRSFRDVLTQTRRYAVGALRNIAAAPRRNKIRLCRYGYGRILDALTDVALYEPVKDIRDRAFAAVHNLVCEETAKMIVEKTPALLGALSDAIQQDAASPNYNTTTGISSEGGDGAAADDSQLIAKKILQALHQNITSDMPCSSVLREFFGTATIGGTSDVDNDESVQSSCKSEEQESAANADSRQDEEVVEEV